MDEGQPIAYAVLEEGVPVLACDGQQVGTVHHVVAAPEQDIFHGLVIIVPGGGRRFVEAADVEQLHERGVDLCIDCTSVEQLSEPGGGAPVYSDDPGAMKGWQHWVHRLGGRGDWKRQR